MRRIEVETVSYIFINPPKFYIMPPLNRVTFVYGNISITIGVYCLGRDAEQQALKVLTETVSNPLDYKIKV